MPVLTRLQDKHSLQHALPTHRQHLPHVDAELQLSARSLPALHDAGRERARLPLPHHEPHQGHVVRVRFRLNEAFFLIRTLSEALSHYQTTLNGRRCERDCALLSTLVLAKVVKGECKNERKVLKRARIE